MLSTEVANQVLDMILGGGTYIPETNVKIALFTSTPNPDGTGGTEVSGGGYAQVTKTNNSTNFPNAANRTKSNGTAITFPPATANWGTITAAGIMKNNGTSLIMLAVFATPIIIAADNTPSFAIGQLEFEEITIVS